MPKTIARRLALAAAASLVLVGGSCGETVPGLDGGAKPADGGAVTPDAPPTGRDGTPDAPPPDAPAADGPLTKPDVGTKPTSTLTDDTYADFAGGKAGEAGAKMYVSAKGNVQLIDRNDLDGDGRLDIVFTNEKDEGKTGVNSYIYWGQPSAPRFTTSKRMQLPTGGSFSNVQTDIDDDGQPDVIFANHSNTKTNGYLLNSYIYYGRSTGARFSVSRRQNLVTLGATHVAVTDLDRNGYLDVIFSQSFNGVDFATANTYVYWGAKGTWGPSPTATARRTEFRAPGATGLSVADLDGDGWLDLITGSIGVSCFVHWNQGKAPWFSSSRRLALPSRGGFGNAVADLDGDGDLDIVIADNFNQSTASRSWVYWNQGKAPWFSTASQLRLPTIGPVSVSLADLNGDSRVDIVFANSDKNDQPAQLNSYVYYNTGKAPWFSATGSNRAIFPTTGAHSAWVADLDSDTYPDLVFGNISNAAAGTARSSRTNSFVYWGTKTGPKATGRLELPTIGTTASTSIDSGSIAKRSPEHAFVSRVLDTKLAAPSFVKLTWKAKVPKNTGLRFQLRSSSISASLASAKWFGPKSTTDGYTATGGKAEATIDPARHKGHRYIQYRALLKSDSGSSPVLDAVSISYN